MTWKSLLQRILLLLIAVALLLPVAALTVWAFGKLLGTMGDAVGGVVLERIALGLMVVWVLDLVFLILVQAIHLLASDEPRQ